MFKFLNKKEEKAEEVAETELTDLVNVSNLKSYVVEGYEKEKQLKSELEQKDKRIQALQKQLHEYDAIKVVLEQKEREITALEKENEKIESLEDRLADSKSKNDDLYIVNQELKANAKSLEQQLRKQITDDLWLKITKRLQSHKGNLSKVIASRIVREVLSEED